MDNVSLVNNAFFIFLGRGGMWDTIHYDTDTFLHLSTACSSVYLRTCHCLILYKILHFQNCDGFSRKVATRDSIAPGCALMAMHFCLLIHSCITTNYSICVSVTVLDAQLATAPTNGSVVLWDINKRTKSKLGKFAIPFTW